MTTTEEKWTILLVDDEEDIREVLSIALMDFGYNVHAVQNGQEALTWFKAHLPPIVVTDIKMPGMDGIELLKAIKHENPEAEVIMITGHGDMNLAIKSLKHEAMDFVTKPINTDAIRIALRRVHEKIVIKQKLKEYTQNLEALIREKVELQDRLSSLGMMIATISHGIKGLLTNLDAGLYMVDAGQKKKDAEKSRDGLNIVRSTTEQIKKLVLDILFYAKEREYLPESADIGHLAGDVADVIEAKAKDRGIALIRDFSEAPASFKLDADMMRVALINILDNAVDACAPETGKSDLQIVFRVKGEEDALVFSVKDSGPGMDAEIREQIFDLFFSTKGTKGTGFGLFIARNIVQQHGGRIRVQSVKGKGTEFIIRLPS